MLGHLLIAPAIMMRTCSARAAAASAILTVDAFGINNSRLAIGKTYRLISSHQQFLTTQLRCLSSSKIKSSTIIGKKKITDHGDAENENEESVDDLTNKMAKTSKIECFGCGSKLQSVSDKQEGFVAVHKMHMLNKRELTFTLCERCEFLNATGKLMKVETSQLDYDRFLEEQLLSLKQGAHVVILVDLLDMPNSIYEGWSKLIKIEEKSSSSSSSLFDIIVLGNKFDLLPNTGPAFMKYVKICLETNLEKKGLTGPQIKHVDVISAKTGYNIEQVINKMFKLWNDDKNQRDVYLLGATNAGKSVFFNQLLSSDYCRPLASNAILRATTSFWPSTTLNMLKFPITRLNEKKYGQRVRRLLADEKLLETVELERSRLYKKTYDLKHAECIGIVGSSFKPEDSMADDQIQVSMDATYSLNEASIDSDGGSSLISECKTYEKSEQIEAEQVELARLKYDPKYFKKRANWFYDTPGLLRKSHEILRNFSKQELQIINPIGM